MDTLLKKSRNKIRIANTDFTRYMLPDIDWTNRMIGIKGARGVGKTTLLMQHIKTSYGLSDEVLYTSLDDIWFTENRLVQLAEKFVNYGGKLLVLDEVHKYSNWSRELKNLYDDYPDLHVVFTGSSALQVLKGEADLSRRALIYEMHGLSFREYLELAHNLKFDILSIDDIVNRHVQLAADIAAGIKPLKYFKEYVQGGYYPYFTENKTSYLRKLESTIRLTIENDLLAILNIDYYSVVKLKKLLYAIATSAPFKPNIKELSEKVGVTRDTLMRYLQYLSDAHLIGLLLAQGKGDNIMVKPEKIYLENPNLYFAITGAAENVGTLRETFLYNQLRVRNKVNWSPQSDFLVDGTYTFEVGGKNKKYNQLGNLPNAYVAADELEVGYMRTIPLWLFGFLY